MDLNKINEICTKYGFSAKNWKDGMIAIIDKKGQFAGHIKDKQIIPKYIGKKVCMGSIIVNELKSIMQSGD